MIATQFESREVFAGGVIAAANHVADFCAEVEIITVIGDSDEDEELIRSSVKPNVKLSIVRQANRPTTRKIRFVESGYMRKLFEVYQMDDAPTEALDALVADRAGRYDVTIAADFGHGAIVPSTIALLDENSRFLAVNTQSNSANAGYNLITKYPRADYICIDTPEARLAMSDRFTSIDRLVKEQLARRVPCEKIVVTQGSKGCLVYARGQGTRHIPVFTKTVVDTVGAGDAFLAVTSPLVAAGGDMELVGFVGNAVGAIKVGIVGHRTSVEKIPLLKYLTTLLK
jgi:sugar/nucleoside kinase (ribokinase family)